MTKKRHKDTANDMDIVPSSAVTTHIPLLYKNPTIQISIHVRYYVFIPILLFHNHIFMNNRFLAFHILRLWVFITNFESQFCDKLNIIIKQLLHIYSLLQRNIGILLIETFQNALVGTPFNKNMFNFHFFDRFYCTKYWL